MRISDWSSDVCSSDLAGRVQPHVVDAWNAAGADQDRIGCHAGHVVVAAQVGVDLAADPAHRGHFGIQAHLDGIARERHRQDLRRVALLVRQEQRHRSEEHTSELQSLMRISYAVFCLKKKTRLTTVRVEITESTSKPQYLQTTCYI